MSRTRRWETSTILESGLDANSVWVGMIEHGLSPSLSSIRIEKDTVEYRRTAGERFGQGSRKDKSPLNGREVKGTWQYEKS